MRSLESGLKVERDINYASDLHEKGEKSVFGSWGSIPKRRDRVS